MSEVNINYKGSSIATMDASGTKTLLTEGKYCEDDIEVVYTRPSGGGSGDGYVWQDQDGYVHLSDEPGTQIQVDSLNVTQNGTYTASSGHAYSPVTVNVSGGGSSANNHIYFIDYDGTVIESYTTTEWASVSALPSNPTHTGLVSQGWNWTKAQIDTQLTAVPDGDIFVGQMYLTSSGDTEIDITFEDSVRLAPYLGFAVNGTATVYWGDNTTSTVTGTSLSSQIRTQHIYSAAGDYTIRIHVDSGAASIYGNNTYSVLNKYSSTINANRVYSNCVRAVRIGNDMGIGNYAFSGCHSLVSITIPSGVTSIGNYACNSCYSLTSITIPNTVTSIGNYMVYYCASLTSIAIPIGVTSIGNNTFAGCYSFTSITIPNTVTSIGTNMFEYCYALTSTVIPSGVTSIGNNTFHNCYSLTSVTIPDTVTSIGSDAFNGCYSLTSITIPSGVTIIGANTFTNCSSLTSITIPNTVTSIGNYAFNSCHSLTSITIPSGVTSIGNYTFQNCFALASIVILSDITSIGNAVFTGCYSLASITIPNTVTSIGTDAFSGCRSLTSITIPSGVTSIGSSAFSNCLSLTSIIIPSGITSIESYTFNNCFSLTSITIPSGVTSIGNYACYNCYSLTSITIPSTVTSIASNAFYYCYGVAEYHILPTTVPTLASGVFTGIQSDCIMYVPSASLTDYQTASGWSTYASYMQGE